MSVTIKIEGTAGTINTTANYVKDLLPELSRNQLREIRRMHNCNSLYFGDELIPSGKLKNDLIENLIKGRARVSVVIDSPSY